MYVPQWEGAIEGYSKNQVKKNLWKFQAVDYEFEDLLHVAVECFCICRDEYQTVENPRHFMSLFKTCLHNRFYDLARKSSTEKEFVFEKVDESLDFLNQGSCESEGPFRTIVKKAPEEVRQVFSLCLNAPTELLDSIGFNRKKDKGFSANKRLCLLLGYDPTKINLVKRVKEYLGRSAKSCF